MDFKLSILRAEAKQFSYLNSATRVRFLALIELAKRRPKGPETMRTVDYEAVGARFGKSGRSIQRWFCRYLSHGARGLIAKKAPGKKRTPIRGHTASLIQEYAKKYGWGSQLIYIHLKYDHGIELGSYRIQRFLQSKGLLRRRKKKKQSKHTQKVVVRIPGAHTQMDVKYFPKKLRWGRQIYVYNFRDHATRWTYKKAYDCLGVLETRQFFQEVLTKCPFKIWSVQTDNGVEFTYQHLSHVDSPKQHPLDLLCKENRIRHRLIPVGEKELQGLVERSHREDDEELYHRVDPKSAHELNQELEKHCIWANEARRRGALNWKTSTEAFRNYRENEHEYQADLALLRKKLHPWLEPQKQGYAEPTKSTS